MIETLDEELRAELIYEGRPEGKTTLIYVPGLGTMGKSKRKVNFLRDKLQRSGYDTNLAVFTYKSHTGDTVTGFENDPNDLEKIISLVKSRGLVDIGLFSVCYGAYVSLEYLSKKNDVQFAVMLEPYLGIESLREPFKSLARTAKKAAQCYWLPKMPIGFRFDGMGYFDVKSFFSSQGSTPMPKDIPVMTFSSKFHSIFDMRFISRYIRDSGYECHVEERGKISSKMLEKFYQLMLDFMARIREKVV